MHPGVNLLQISSFCAGHSSDLSPDVRIIGYSVHGAYLFPPSHRKVCYFFLYDFSKYFIYCGLD